jgi:protein transport protein DSL1/ZW10
VYEERITLMGEALRSNEILVEWSDAEKALSAALYHLRHLSQAWKPILSYDILNRSMCYLVDVTFTLFLDQIAKATDISSSACAFVFSLFQKATHDLEVLLNGDTSGSRVWDRFSAVGRIMDMSIADIQVALADGVFRSVTGPELSRLVTSCFDDTPKRRMLIKTLAASQ